MDALAKNDEWKLRRMTLMNSASEKNETDDEST